VYNLTLIEIIITILKDPK